MSAFRPCLGEEERRKDEVEPRLRTAEDLADIPYSSNGVEHAHRDSVAVFD